MQIPVGTDRVKVYAEVTTPTGPVNAPARSRPGRVFVGKLHGEGLRALHVPGHRRRHDAAQGALHARAAALRSGVRPDKPQDEGGHDGGGKGCDKTIAIFVDTVKGNARLAKMLDAYLRRNGSSLKELLACLRGRGRSASDSRSLADALRTAADALESR